MSNDSNARTIAALEKMIHEMQFLVDHPRMQQRNWVASGKIWLPILRHAIEDLSRVPGSSAANTVSPSPAVESKSILVKVNAGGGETYVHVSLENVAEVTVYRSGEGYRYTRGAHSGFRLKDGRQYLTNADEAQRIVDAMRGQDKKS
jgi:hypothetical protein